jgi:hypothetical protein
MNKYISLLGIALLLLSGVVSAGTLTLCTGNSPAAMEGYKFQLLNLLPAKAGTTATMNILGVASPVTLGVDNSVPHIYTDSATGNKIKLVLKSTTNQKCIYLDVDVEKPTPASCTDSDKFDLNSAGKVTAFDPETGKTSEYVDYCTNENTVFEYYCSGVRAEGYANACGEGYACSNGACVKESTKNDVCYDGDSGYSYYTPGKTYIVGKSDSEVADYCADASTVIEYVCVKGAAGDVISSTKYQCPSGYSCNDGACVKESTKNDVCYDGDSGYSYYTPGKTYIVGKSDSEVADYCADASTVIEYVCVKGAAGDMVSSTKYVCPSGYECSSGACVKKAEEKPEKKPFCSETDGGYDIYTKGTRTTDGGVATEACNEKGQLVETWCHGNYGYTKAVDCPSGYVCSDGACVVKPAETNTTTTTENLPLTVYVLSSDISYVKNAYVTMYKLSDDSAVRSFYTDKDGKAYFYSWHFTAGEPVYFLATKGGKTYEGSLEKLPTVEYKDGKYCIYKSGVSECLDRYSLGLFEVVKPTEINESEKPPLPPTENVTASYYTIAIQPGWNLISVPFESGKLTTTDCDTTTLYTLNPVGRTYNKENLNGKSWFGFQGYWMKSSKECKLQFEVSAEDGFYTASKLDSATGRFATSLKLSKGWNMVGAPHGGTTFSEIAGTCTLSSGPWGYNSGTNSWEKATTLESGKGYFVKVTEDCVLGGSMPPLPPS